MAHSEQIPAAELRSLARQIVDRMPSPVTGLFAAAAPARLAESFPIWMLAPQTAEHPRDIAEAARPTGAWHHQIRGPLGAMSFARSAVSDGKWRIGEMARSGLETDIEAAIDWIDTHVPQDLEARLLIAPAYQLTAFWLHGAGDDRVVVAQAPATLRNLESQIDYPAEEFLARLAENRPSAGVPALPEDHP